MSKSENKPPSLSLHPSDIAFYADISEPHARRRFSCGILESLPKGQVYLSTTPAERRQIVRELLASQAHAIFILGNDSGIEQFLNLYRDLNPNPSRTHLFGFVPVGQSHFASRFCLGLSVSRLSQIASMHFSVCRLCFPEIHSHLALHIGVGHLLSSVRYIPQSLSRQLMHTPLARQLPGMYAMTCLNEAPDACVLSPHGTILRHLSKDQILFNQHILTMRIDPSLLAPPGMPETRSHFFELRVRTLVSPGRWMLPIRHQTESFLCQRVKLEFAHPAMLHTCSSASEVSTLSITLSGRTYPCLMPLQTSSSLETPLDSADGMRYDDP